MVRLGISRGKKRRMVSGRIGQPEPIHRPTGVGGAGGEFLMKKSYCGQTTSHNRWYGKADVRSR